MFSRWLVFVGVSRIGLNLEDVDVDAWKFSNRVNTS
jgi:hypothetical protein